MSPDLQPIVDSETVARVLLHGDLKNLTPTQKISYYRAVCESVGLNPLTQPFQYLVLNGKEVLYARREATEQLRHLHNVSVTIAARELVDDIYVVTARATLPTGRVDENIGAVAVGGLKGEARANAFMKAETKSKRRVTLAICGLGLLDETEVVDLPAVATSREVPARPALAADVPPTAPDPELPAGVVLVREVTQAKTKNPNVTKYSVTVSTGEVFTTINGWLASRAKEFGEAGTPVKITTKETKFGTDVTAINPADEPPMEPLPLDEIPF